MNPTNRERVILLENAKRIAARKHQDELFWQSKWQQTLHSEVTLSAWCLFAAFIGTLVLGAIVWLWQ